MNTLLIFLLKLPFKVFFFLIEVSCKTSFEDSDQYERKWAFEPRGENGDMIAAVKKHKNRM